MFSPSKFERPRRICSRISIEISEEMKALYFPLGAVIRLAVLFNIRSLLRNLFIIDHQCPLKNHKSSLKILKIRFLQR